MHPTTRSWGYQLAFSSTEDLASKGSTGRQVFLFGLFDYDCAFGTPTAELASCPNPPPFYLVQVTDGPGDADNGSASRTGAVVAFDADGSYDGGSGPGVGHRQIFVLDLTSSILTRVTDDPNGDSVRPSLDEDGRHLVFESTASLGGGSAGVSQVYAFDLVKNTLTRLTNGAGPSTGVMPTRRGRVVAFESTADLRGDGHDTGVSQIFWFDVVHAALHQMTRGNAPSHHPYPTARLRGRALRKAIGRGTAIAFDSAATDLPGTSGGPGTQVYVGSTSGGDLPPIVQVTPLNTPCTPLVPGDSSFPAIDGANRRIAFIGTGDLLCNGSLGAQAFVLDPTRTPATLFQLTARGNVVGPLGASMGHWFVTMATTDDLTGLGVCGAQLQLVDYFTDHWQAASVAGTLPGEPPLGPGCLP
jgi:hypothetical protein